MTRDCDTRNLLVERYLHLADGAARAMAQTTPVEFDVLRSAACLGLIQAVEGFDPRRGLRFTTYASPRITGAMRDELRLLDHAKRSARSRGRTLDAAEERLTHAHGRPVSDEDLAAALGWDEDQVHAVRRLCSPAEPLPERPYDLAAPTPRNHVPFVEPLLRGLLEVEREVLVRHDMGDERLRAIGGSVGLSESRMSQIRSAALEWIRAHHRHDDASP